MAHHHIQRYNYFFQQILDATGTFTKPIFVPFVPTEVKVKQIGFQLTGATAGVFNLNCDSLVGQSNSNLGIMIDAIVSFNGIVYPLTSSPDGIHTFRVMEEGNVAATLNGASLAVHLEFRRIA
jgi:hypothetical protein